MTISNNYVNKINAGASQSAQHLLTNLAERVVYDQALESTEAQKKRPRYYFSKVVTAEQQNLITSAYPEFTITFTGTSLSVHAVAGGVRGLETELLMTMVPYKAACYDIGGNYVRHLLKGRDYVHCCNPTLSIRDGARYETYKDELRKVSCKDADSVGSWGAPGGSSYRSRSLLPHQQNAFERYATNSHAVVCTDTFETCTFAPPTNGCTYAIMLHGLYDIPCESLGAALLRKNVHVAYAAFHLSEEMLWKDADGIFPVNDIDAIFERNGDRVIFRFRDEATIAYEHSFRNVAAHALKTYYPAGDGKVYFKEFLCRRLGTVFAKFTLVDTYKMHKSVFHKSVDGSQFIDAMDEAFSVKREAALFAAERMMLRDKSSLALWFPEAKNKIEIPIFRASISGKRKIKADKVLVDKTFFYTVFNHVMGYQDKNVSFQTINNFVESVVSRVVINGTSVRPEWNVDKDLICDISLTLHLMVQLRKMQNKVVADKMSVTSDDFWSALKSNFCAGINAIWPNFLEFSRNRGWLSVIENKLVVTAPNEFLAFDDYIVMEYSKTVDDHPVDVDFLISNSDKLYNEVSRLASLFPTLNVDIAAFRDFCNTEKIPADFVGKIFEALVSDKVGLSVTGGDNTLTNLKTACTEQKVDGCVKVATTSSSTPIHDAALSGEAVFPLSGDSRAEYNFWFKDEDGVPVDLSDFHGLDTKTIAKPQKMAVIYRGSLKQRQMLNFLDYMAASLCATVNNLQRALRQWWTGDKRNPKDVGIFDCKRGVWVTEPSKKHHTWGVAQLHDLTFRVVVLNYNGDIPCCDSEWKSLGVSTDTKVFSFLKMLHNLRMCLKDGMPPEPQCRSILIDGVPGCGKTSEILRRCDFSKDLVLTPTREAAQMIRRRANEPRKQKIADESNVRTIDSFIMNPKPIIYETVWIDEGLMVHPGLVWFCAQLSQCTTLNIFGDVKQIPFIPRVDNFDLPNELKSLTVDEVDSRDVTHRCPVDVTAWLAKTYQRNITTTSSVDKSVEAALVPGKATFNAQTFPLPGKILTFTQAEKQDLIKAGYNDVSTVTEFNVGSSVVNTVHEIQGETYPVVNIVRCNPHPISIISRNSPHVVVALSRHTVKCKYFSVVADVLVDAINEIGSLNPFFYDLYKSLGSTA
ncbi:replicase [Cactus mild mottle virus]|uniref:Replicase n=3 Tax=Cactus mild mottle virus TaxID=229030 RepID=B8PRG6_9VIRU|nr:128 kDa [Cactus mild mottle virus]ABX57120.1 replicase [Cactus mild mottle virus]